MANDLRYHNTMGLIRNLRNAAECHTEHCPGESCIVMLGFGGLLGAAIELARPLQASGTLTFSQLTELAELINFDEWPH